MIFTHKDCHYLKLVKFIVDRAPFFVWETHPYTTCIWS